MSHIHDSFEVLFHLCALIQDMIQEGGQIREHRKGLGQGLGAV